MSASKTYAICFSEPTSMSGNVSQCSFLWALRRDTTYDRVSLLAFWGSVVLATARAPLLALWYLDKGPVRGSLMKSPVLPALRSRGRDAGIPAGADVDVDVLPPPLPSIS